MSSTPPVAFIHDYLTQRGGAERVLLTLAGAYPDAPIYTSLYDPAGTFPEFADRDIHTLPVDRVALLRRHHRLSLPFLAPSFARLHVDADVAVCLSTGWAHGAHVTGAKVVYCSTPARWLYQPDRYLDGSSLLTATALAVLAPPLRRWDGKAAATADRYIANSRIVRSRIADIYGIDADLIPPPVDVDTTGRREPVTGIDPGFVLCVSRLLAYKNVGAVVDAFTGLADQRLVVVGSGPLADDLRAAAAPNVTMLGRVTDAELRWLYASCLGLVAASYEDFGLTPIEAAAFGRPTAALRWGGFLDTIVEGETGCLFDAPTPQCIAAAVGELAAHPWSSDRIQSHARRFAPDRFLAQIAAVLDDVR